MSKLASNDTQKSEILRLLRASNIVSNVELEHVSPDFDTLLNDLRDQGYVIDSKHLGGDLWKFTYRGRPTDERGDS